MQGDYIMPEQDTRRRTGRRRTPQEYTPTIHVFRAFGRNFRPPLEREARRKHTSRSFTRAPCVVSTEVGHLPESKANSRRRAVKDEETNEGTGHFCL